VFVSSYQFFVAAVLLVFCSAVWAFWKRAVVDSVAINASGRFADVKTAMWAYGFLDWNSLIAVWASAQFSHLLSEVCEICACNERCAYGDKQNKKGHGIGCVWFVLIRC
jgi:hypothetical protein